MLDADEKKKFQDMIAGNAEAADYATALAFCPAACVSAKKAYLRG